MTDRNDPVLAVDVDGVLLDYVTGVHAYGVSLGHQTGCGVHEITRWDLSELFPTLTQDEKNALYTAFSTHETFAALNPYEGAAEALKRIRESIPGLRVVAITSAGSHPDTAVLRRTNLAAFAIDEVHVIGMGESKRDHLAALPPGSVFVDDLLEHVLTAEEVGVEAILFRRSYNTDHSHVRVVHDWTEAADAVLRIMGRVPIPTPAGP